MKIMHGKTACSTEFSARNWKQNEIGRPYFVMFVMLVYTYVYSYLHCCWCAWYIPGTCMCFIYACFGKRWNQWRKWSIIIIRSWKPCASDTTYSMLNNTINNIICTYVCRVFTCSSTDIPGIVVLHEWALPSCLCGSVFRQTEVRRNVRRRKNEKQKTRGESNRESC